MVLDTVNSGNSNNRYRWKMKKETKGGIWGPESEEIFIPIQSQAGRDKKKIYEIQLTLALATPATSGTWTKGREGQGSPNMSFPISLSSGQDHYSLTLTIVLWKKPFHRSFLNWLESKGKVNGGPGNETFPGTAKLPLGTATALWSITSKNTD